MSGLWFLAVNKKVGKTIDDKTPGGVVNMLRFLTPESLLWIAVTVFCTGCILWRYWLHPRWQKRRIARIEAFEREKDPLSRGVLIRKILARPLMIPVFLGLLTGALYFWQRLTGVKSDAGYWQFPLLFTLLLWAIGLPNSIEQILAIWKGNFQLRRLVASGSRTETRTTFQKNSTVTFYFLGTAPGDSSFYTQTRLEQGTWYLAVIVDGEVVSAVPAARWRPDLELKKRMPPEEASRC